LWTGADVGALAKVRHRYRRDLQRDFERLQAFSPSIFETPFGGVEFA
jgi:hypothetical protein